MQKRQTTLFELKVVRCHQKEGPEESNNDEDSSGDDPDDLSGSESGDPGNPTLSSSSELLMTEDTNTSVPADIAQSKYHSPIQPILQNYPRTTFGTGKNSRNRSFSHHWYSKFPFIEYSASKDAVFCYACRLFPHPTAFIEPVFTSVGYRGWKSIRKSLEKHQSSGAHKSSMARWASFNQSKDHGAVADMLVSQRRTIIQENRKYLQTMLKIALLCARQDLALRGHDESQNSENKGNFKEILALLASENPTLKHQLENAPSNAKYISKEIQNDLLKAAATVVLHSICEDIHSAYYFSLIADECRDVSRTEQLSLCLRFVSRQDNNIKERFVGFTDVHELDASSLAGEIMRQLGQLGLDPSKCISQCYDGASVMSGHLAGVQAIVQRSLGHGCLYIHCYAHRLNLVLVDTARGNDDVNNFFGLLEAVYRFFSVSTLRHDSFINSQRLKGLRVLEIPQLSDTRWACRYMAVHLFQTRYECLLEALDDIERSRDRSAAAEARGLVMQLKSLSFLAILCIFEEILGLTKPLSDHLQSKELDLSCAIDLVESVKKTFAEYRSDSHFSSHIWNRVTELAHTRDIEMCMHERRRSRVPARLADGIVLSSTGSRDLESEASLESTFRKLYFEVIDRILSELNKRFDQSATMLKGIAACSPNSCSFFDMEVIRPLAEQYGIDTHSLAPQLDVAKNLLKSRGACNLEQSLEIMISVEAAFPLIIRLLILAMTFPVTSASAERSFSALKRIKTYLRSTMHQDRLCHLAILSIERTLSGSLDMDKVIDKFDEEHPRRILLH